jgi:hypothetical protein
MEEMAVKFLIQKTDWIVQNHEVQKFKGLLNLGNSNTLI